MKAVKVMCDVSAAPRGVSDTSHGMLATQDTHGNSRGLEAPAGGFTIHEKKILRSFI